MDFGLILRSLFENHNHLKSFVALISSNSFHFLLIYFPQSICTLNCLHDHAVIQNPTVYLNYILF